MRKTTIKVYKYSELSEKAKAKVLSHFRENNTNDFLSDDLTEFIREELKKKRIFNENLKVYYSLSNCQGDGLCFIGTFGYKKNKIYIKHSGMYYHSNSVTFETENKNGELIETDKSFIELYKNICKKAEKIGYETMDYEDSETAIKENIDANDYEFYDNGDIF